MDSSFTNKFNFAAGTTALIGRFRLSTFGDFGAIEEGEDELTGDVWKNSGKLAVPATEINSGFPSKGKAGSDPADPIFPDGDKGGYGKFDSFSSG